MTNLILEMIVDKGEVEGGGKWVSPLICVEEKGGCADKESLYILFLMLGCFCVYT